MHRWATALWEAIKRFGDRNAYSSSAHIAMAMMLAIFPFTASAISLASILAADVDPQTIVDLIFGAWPDAVAEPVLREMQAVAKQSTSGTLTVGLLLAFFFASNGVNAIRLAITEAYHDTDDRPIWTTRLLSLAFVLAGSILLVTVSTLQVGLPIYLKYVGGETLSGMAGLLLSDTYRALVTLLLLTFVVLACHRWLPGHAQPFRVLLPGVALTLILWVIAGYGFSYYLANLADYSVTYAGLAGVMATLIFLNLMAAIFILGAEFNGRLKEIPK
ncbi:MAG: YihY/virulence factor BrkB family protein [Dinoroseobacter sp.]|nr:YihY/virulence factor BrkB family protein [Dinoroseobacter sp.]